MQIGTPGEPVSHLSQAYPDRVEVRGRDLAGDLMGRLTFTEYFHLLVTGREPTEDELLRGVELPCDQDLLVGRERHPRGLTIHLQLLPPWS